MAELQRITTEYLEAEDRIRLTGQAGDGAPVVLWLTQRLLQRLLPVLLQSFAVQDADAPHGQMPHDFYQQAAKAGWPPELPVQAGPDSTAWLVLSVDITQSAEAASLTFKGAHGQQVSLKLTARPLRQWLGIVHAAYLKADWPLQAWPQWLREGRLPTSPPAMLLH